MEKLIKPPLGIIPKQIHTEIRFDELKAAIQRYLDANLNVNIEWVEEYNDILKQIKL